MLKQSLITVLTTAGFLLSANAFAHSNHHNHSHTWVKPKSAYNVDAAQAKLNSLIQKGINNRTLTRYEEDKAKRKLKEIANLEHQYRKGGLQRWELKTLKQHLEASERQIYSYLNNAEYRRVKHKRQHHPRPHHHKSGHRNSGGSFTVWISK